MQNKRVAICVIAYNEEQNIGHLLGKLIDEDIKNKHIFVYTDGSTDETAKIVKTIEKKYSEIITHIRVEKKYGKHRAYNSLLTRIEGYRYALFLDADIDFTKGELQMLIEYLDNNKQYKVVSPRLRPEIEGWKGLNKQVSKLYGKVKTHFYNHGHYNYFTGRTLAAITRYLPIIPDRSYEYDFYLNLQFKTEEMGICPDSEVSYFMPSSFWGMFFYSYRMGNSLADVKRKFPKLWLEQIRRIPVTDYAVFGLTRFRFWRFWISLKLKEKLVFIYSRIVTASGFYIGFLSKRKGYDWVRIKETKRNF